MELSQIFKRFPAFHSWFVKKKLNLKDLSILTEFKDSLAFEPLIEWMGKREPSHFEGRQILDLGGELLLMGKPLKALLERETKAPELIESLKKLRWAETMRRDEQKSQIVKSLKGPSSIKAQWIRQNDKGALSIHFKSCSLQDLKQKIQSLNALYKQLGDGSKKLWRD